MRKAAINGWPMTSFPRTNVVAASQHSTALVRITARCAYPSGPAESDPLVPVPPLAGTDLTVGDTCMARKVTLRRDARLRVDPTNSRTKNRVIRHSLSCQLPPTVDKFPKASF
jgi:hypothetical protein